MPKVSVYLPEDPYRSARKQGLAISALAQRAIEAELRSTANNAWIERMRARPPRQHPLVDTTRLIDEVRRAFGA